MIPVEGHPGLYRDPSSNAIINTNTKGAQIAVAARLKREKQDETIKDLRNEIDELKDLVTKLLERMDT
jgi:hypothetical protein